MTFDEIERELIRRKDEDELFPHALEMLRMLHTGLNRAKSASANYDGVLRSLADDATAYLRADTTGSGLHKSPGKTKE